MTKRLTTKGFIERSLVSQENKYDYSKTKIVNNKTPVTITCKKHKEDFVQFPQNHMKGAIGCTKCKIDKWGTKYGKTRWEKNRTTRESMFINNAQTKHKGRYYYPVGNYVNSYTKTTIYCPDHGDFLQTPHHHLGGNGCPKCGAIKAAHGLFRFHATYKHTPNKPCTFYVAELYSENEHFFKAGVTTKTPDERLARIPYEYKILFKHETTVKHALDLEENIKRTITDFTYTPQKKFGGRSECFSENPIKHDWHLQEFLPDPEVYPHL
jgi:Zn finger protein HypA/HybF involved in hydrogenase expression